MKRTAFDFLFMRTPQVIAAIFLAVGVLLPSDGAGVVLCMFKRVFSLPCPGCGLTRSVSSILHGDLLKSWGYHPLGLFFVGLMVLLTFNLVMPGGVVSKVRRFFDQRYDPLEIGLIAFAAIFIGFGLTRLGVFFLTGSSY